MMIRPAKIPDVKSVYTLIKHYADNREMLHRSLNGIYENIQEFVVLENDGKIIACGALHVSWEDLAEVRALAVSEEQKGKGIGRQIVKRLHQNAIELGIRRMFVLTFKPAFFRKLGYVEVTKEILPHKVWSECVNCYLFPDCGEVPLIFYVN
ncbi:MAG: N-acetyltransferase [Endomicrobium sp.]|jgi:amino-acid N-acetyltransferase|nr:N-acetyltransferase [Endomicrobium sp.]